MTRPGRWPVEPAPGEATPVPFGMSAYCVADPAQRAPGRPALVVVHGGLDEIDVTLAGEDAWRLRWDSAWERPEDGEAGQPAEGSATMTPLSLRLYTT